MIVVAYVAAAAVLFWLGMIFPLLGGLIFVILAAVLAALKRAGIFVWSWWWAMHPLWTALGGAATKMHIAARDPRFFLKLPCRIGFTCLRTSCNPLNGL